MKLLHHVKCTTLLLILSEIATLQEPRFSAGAAVVDNKVYVIGGLGGLENIDQGVRAIVRATVKRNGNGKLCATCQKEGKVLQYLPCS